MKYVTVIGSSGKVIAVGKVKKYYGKWLTVIRNDNEEVAVNTDFVQAIHFLRVPTAEMLTAMNKSVPTTDDMPTESAPKIAVKTTSGRTEVTPEALVQQIINAGPPEMRGEETADIGLFALPRVVKLPNGVQLDRKKKRKRDDNQ